jgi:hypothetical protein
VVRKILNRVDAITLLINVLQVEAVNEVIADGAAMEKIDEKGTRCSSAQQAGEISETGQSSKRVAGQRRQHRGARGRLFRRHKTRNRFVALGNKEGNSSAQDDSHNSHAHQRAPVIPKQPGVAEPVRHGLGFWRHDPGGSH